MLFNSIDFAIFLPVVFILYWLNDNIRYQNILIVLASYVFYAWWDWRFLFLIVFSTIVDYSVGRKLKNAENQIKRKILLWTSISINLGFLCYFKYYNFFLDNFISAFTLLGVRLESSSLNIILPVGISFYTFQTLSYTIDVYKRKLDPTKDVVAFSAFVCFFPQLVAGPIERATNLLPQFFQRRSFNYSNSVDGLRQLLWGLFKKMVIADSCAEYVNIIYGAEDLYPGSSLLLGSALFSVQIYCDFSGYSDIAIGSARLLGFDLMKNFAFPYFSRDIPEFWRRWHISLSTWFRDYVYIPLGGSRVGQFKQFKNIFVIFLLSGLWHGANWTFVIWGLLHAIFYLPSFIVKSNRKNLDTVAEGYIFPSFRNILRIGLTFLLTTFGWIFFRSSSLDQAFTIIGKIFSKSILVFPYIVEEQSGNKILPKMKILLIVVFFLVEWITRNLDHPLQALEQTRFKLLNQLVYFLLFIAIIFIGGTRQEFVYFQF